MAISRRQPPAGLYITRIVAAVRKRGLSAKLSDHGMLCSMSRRAIRGQRADGELLWDTEMDWYIIESTKAEPKQEQTSSSISKYSITDTAANGAWDEVA